MASEPGLEWLEMIAVKAHFDGEKIVLPEELRGQRPGDVILILENSSDERSDLQLWMKGQEPAFAKAWDNDADGDYDRL